MKKHNETNKKRSKLGTCIVAGLLGIASLTGVLTGCGTQSGEPSDTLHVGDFVNSSYISLFAETEPVANTQDEMTAILEAVISPSDAPDKTVDWNITWGVNGEGEDAIVTDYVTVTPSSDGALTAKVEALQAFPNSTALVTVTTRLGGFSAQCTVSYSGKPSKTLFVHDGAEHESGAKLSLDIGSTYDIQLKPTNKFDVVGDKYKSYELESVELLGEFFVNISGYESHYYADYIRKMAYSEFNDCLSDYVDISVANDVLNINAKRAISSFSGYAQSQYETENIEDLYDTKVYATLVSNDVTVTPDNYSQQIFEGANLAEYNSGAENCIIRIVVRESVTKIVSYIDINITSTVTGVKLNNSTLEF